MNGWKQKTLSFVGQLTLAQLVLQTMPNYTMQTTHIPRHTFNKIDRKIRSFIWGEQMNQGKWFLSNGIKCVKARKVVVWDTNLAFLMKLAWELIAKPSASWVRVLRSKYGTEPGMIPQVNRKQQMSNS